MKKMILSVLAIVLCFCVSPISVFASEGDGTMNLTSNIEKSEEYASLVSLEKDLIRQMQVLAKAAKKDTLPTSIDFKKAVRVFVLDNLDSSNAVKTASKNSSYYYRIPLAIDEGYIYSTIVVTDGKVTGYDTSMTYDTALGQVSYLFDEKLVEDLLVTFSEKVTDVTVLTISAIKTDFVYFIAGDKAYAIPFSSRPDFLNLENGEIYEYDRIISCAKALLSEMQDDNIYAGNHGGAGGGHMGSANENTLYYIIASIITVLGLTAVSVSFLKRKRRNAK